MPAADEALEVHDVVTAGPALGLAGLLDDPWVPSPGDHLPPFWHWLYGLSRPPRADIGPDGHPVRGAVPAPPGPGTRRMFAGGRLQCLAPLSIGSSITRTSKVVSRRDTVGRSGPLTFVRVRHEIWNDGLAIVDEQDIVYRPQSREASATATPSPPEIEPSGRDRVRRTRSIDVTPPMLFQFSALTYNSHRIHYDRDYARHEEGYSGLVVHGPLQVVTMAHLAGHLMDGTETLLAFDYRLVAPLVEGQGLLVEASVDDDGTVQTETRDATGRVTARGSLSPSRAR